MKLYKSIGSFGLIDFIEWYIKIKPAFSVELAIDCDDPGQTVAYTRVRLCLTTAIKIGTERVLPAIIAFYTAQQAYQALSRRSGAHTGLCSLEGLISLCDVVHCARTASFFMRNKTKSSKSQDAVEAAEAESAERAAEAAEAAILRSNFTFDKLIETFDSGLAADVAPEDAAAASPLADALQCGHDALFARLFQS
jgi:hypothetical protein